jgi:hypothetical protein
MVARSFFPIMNHGQNSGYRSHVEEEQDQGLRPPEQAKQPDVSDFSVCWVRPHNTVLGCVDGSMLADDSTHRFPGQ